MAKNKNETTDTETKGRRGRGPTKTYPVLPFEKVEDFANGVAAHGISGEIQRLTLMSKLGISPNSSGTRSLISSGSRYGLTQGSYQAPSLKLTDAGKQLLAAHANTSDRKQKRFDLAIANSAPFVTVYDRIKENRLPDVRVLRDEFVRLGLSESDATEATEIFVGNLRHVGLIEDISGSDHVRDIDIIGKDDPISVTDAPDNSAQGMKETPKPRPATTEKGEGGISAPQTPSVHIDIQIHIDASATAGQIDQVFASMSKHLYRT